MNGLYIHNLTFLGKGPFSLTVESACCTGITGSSGSGKSLLLRAIADLDPHEGEVRLSGVSCEDVSAAKWRKIIGMLPAESAWWFDTVGEHFSAKETTSAGKLVQQLGFSSDVFSWQIQRLSTGERQRLAIVRLLLNKPGALLLDEPTASLDADNVGRAEELLTRYRLKEKIPVLWVSHDPEQLIRVADRRLFMKHDGNGLQEKES